jgi:hypothetical protein
MSLLLCDNGKLFGPGLGCIVVHLLRIKNRFVTELLIGITWMKEWNKRRVEGMIGCKQRGRMAREDKEEFCNHGVQRLASLLGMWTFDISN